MIRIHSSKNNAFISYSTFKQVNTQINACSNSLRSRGSRCSPRGTKLTECVDECSNLPENLIPFAYYYK